ncbi:beta-ketoacyl synthase N-terminal-like domain-containing protein, partial [Amycolatopsis sp. NPDC000740]
PELVLSGWSAASPFGLGARAFTAGLAAGAPAPRAAVAGPCRKARLIPDFDARSALGPKGTRSMDRVTAMAVTTAGLVLDDTGSRPVSRPEQIGLVLGTGSGSVQSIVDFTASSMTGDKPYHVDPARFPNTVMNRAAGQSAIWHGLKGPNATVSGGAPTGLLVLNYAARLLRNGRCERIVCGAAEEYSEQRGWLEWHAAGRPEEQDVSEGCALFLLETLDGAANAGRTPLADLLGNGFAVSPDRASVADTLAGCLRSTLARAGVRPADVGVVAGSAEPAEQIALTTVLDNQRRIRLEVRGLLGDTAAAAAAFQLAGVLAHARLDSGTAGRVAVVTSVDRRGGVGCTVLRIRSAGPDTTKEENDE